MNAIAEILWEAAADVDAAKPPKPLSPSDLYDAARMLAMAAGVPTSPWDMLTTATTAAAMRDAAFLAEWAGPWLLGGSK